METERTYLRPFTMNDIDNAYKWFSNLNVMKYTPSGIDKSINATKKRIIHYIEHHQEHGFSKYIISDIKNSMPIGDAGVLWLDELNSFELGFRLIQEKWNQGYGTEVASAWINEMKKHKVINIMAFAHEDNIYSCKILDKCHFTYLEKRVILGMESNLYVKDL